MKKLNIYVLLTILLFTFNSFSQDFKTAITTEENQEQIISHLSTDDFDDYDIIITLFKNETFLTDYTALFIKPRFTVNSQLINEDEYSWSVLNMYTSENAEEDDFFLHNPAVKYEIMLGEFIKDIAHLVNEKNNQLLIEFIYEEKVLTSANLTFDIPGFTDYTSSFCDLKKYSTKNKENNLNNLLKQDLEKNFPAASNVEVFSSEYGWSEYEGNNQIEQSGTFLILFKENDKYWFIRYEVSYFTKSGVKDENPKIKFYNGIKNPSPVSSECLKSLEKSIK